MKLVCLAGHPPYQIQKVVTRQVASDCLVCVDTNRYSVPHPYVGQQVEILSVGGELRIYHRGECIATHSLLEGKYQRRMVAAHYEGLFPGSSEKKESSAVGVWMWDPGQNEVQIRPLSEYEVLCGVSSGATEGGVS